LGITRRDRERNEAVREKLEQKVTIIERIRKRRLTWFGHVMRIDGNRLPVRAMHCRVEGTRSRGRQLKRWIDNIKEDLEACNLDMETSQDLKKTAIDGEPLSQPHHRRQADGRVA